MYALSLLILIGLTLLSFIPVLRLHHYKNYAKFTALRYTVNIVFTWAVLMTVKYIIADYHPVLGFYMHVTGYVVVLLVAMSFYSTIMSFIHHPISKTVKVIAMIYLALFTLALALNDVLHLLIVEGSEEMDGLHDVLNFHVTGLFDIHVIIAYLILIIPVVILLVYLRSRRQKELYKVPYLYFLIALVIGLILNFIHVFIYTFFLDPTLMVVVVFSFLLYHLIYHKDMGFILMSESRKTLIDNMREMYLVTDEDGFVIDYSEEMKQRFDIDRTEKLETIIEALKEKAVLYEDIDEVEDKSSSLPYLYTIRKTFKLGKTHYQGKLYLFYDETNFVKIMQKLEYLQSHDEMTGLYNRNYFEQQLPTFQETYPNAAIVIADINGLKLFNDNFGHKAGDDLILGFAAILKSLVGDQEGTRLIRIGGDEFLIFIGNGDEADAKAFKDALLEKTYHEDPLKRISTSVGYAVRRKDEHLETTFLRADNALYAMKKETSEDYKKAFRDAYKKLKKE